MANNGRIRLSQVMRGFTAHVLIVVCSILLGNWSCVFAEAALSGLPDPQGYVSDHASVLDEEWHERIRSVCKDMEKKTGIEMVVVTVRTIEPFLSVKEYADALFEKWGIGTAQQEYGVLVLAAIDQQQATVTLSRNMIRVIAPPVLEKVKTKYVEPNFRLGLYGKGLYQTVVGLASVSQDIRVGVPSRKHIKGVGFWLTLFTIVGGISVFWWMSRPDKRHPFRKIQVGEYWGTGQGGFGGNFGGFQGGMTGEDWKK